MDGSWQVKCGSALQASAPPMASAALPEPRNQMEISSSHYLYPYSGQDPRSQVHGRMQDPSFTNISNVNSHFSGHCEEGNSFLALLSGPASLLHCDFQDLSNPKPVGTVGKLPVEGSGTVVRGIGNGRILSDNVGFTNLQNGADLSAVVSSGVAASSHSGGSSVLPHGLQAANCSLQASDLAKAVMDGFIPGNDKGKDFPSVRGEPHGTIPSNAMKVQKQNLQIPEQPKVESGPSVSSTSTTGCPRVFCLGTSGDLLLSNTGLLGILCSCHCFHMSVSRFCEHSGLCNVNPGDAVRMDSGETLSQWRRLYFQKSGIRVPEDHSGWDWPEGLSLTASLVKSGVSLTNVSKDSGCHHLLGSSGGLLRSGPSADDFFLKKTSSDQNIVIDGLNSKQKSGHDGNTFLPTGLVGSSLCNTQSVGHAKVKGCPIFGCSTMPNVIETGLENGCQSISSYINNIMRTGSFSTANPHLQNSGTTKSSNVSGTKYAKGGCILDKDAASSSIELRLGQPCPRNQFSVNPVLDPLFHNKFVGLQKPKFQGQKIGNANNCEKEEESRKYLPCTSVSSSTTRREQQHRSLTINDVADSANLEKLEGNMTSPLVVDSLYKHFNTSPQESSYPKATNDVIHIGKHVMPETVHWESRSVKCDSQKIPWNSVNCLERQWAVPEMCFSRPADRGGVGCLAGSPYTEIGFRSKTHKWIESPSSFAEIASGNSYNGVPALHDKNRNPHHLSTVPPDASDAGNLSNYLEKIPCFGSSGLANHVLLNSMGLPLGSGKLVPQQVLPMGFPSTPLTSIPGLTQSLFRPEVMGGSSHVLDDNLKVIALRQIVELSKQQCGISSFANNPEQGRMGSSSNVKVQHSVVEPSKSGENMHGPNLTSKQEVSEVAMKLAQCGYISKMSSDLDKFSSVTGLNNCCNFSTLKHGIPLECKETDLPRQLSHDPNQNEQPSVRLGRSANSISHPNEHQCCCQRKMYFQENCSCEAYTCSGRKLTGGNIHNSCRKEVKTGNSSVLFSRQFVEDHIVPERNTMPLGLHEKALGQLPTNLSCASQWKDVPNKVRRVCEVACVKQSAQLLDRRGQDQLGDTAAKCSSGAVHMEESCKEQEMSNLSSGCSAPAVIQASIEVNNMDSPPVIAADPVHGNNFVVDEGSGIDRCWSSDDALESDRSAGFYDSTFKTDLKKEGSSRLTDDRSSRSLLDEVKLMDSLTWKKGRNQCHSGIIHGKTNHLLESQSGFQTRKRKREVKLKMLDASLGTVDPAMHCKSSENVVTAEHPCSSKDVQMLSSLSSGAYSAMKPKLGKSTSSVAKALSRKRDLHGLYDIKDDEDNHITRVKGDDKQKFRSTSTPDDCLQFQMQESDCEAGETSLECDSARCIKELQMPQLNVSYLKERPTVYGIYGEITSRKMDEEVSKPVKIVPLSRILKTARRCTLPKSCKPQSILPRNLKGARFGWSNACLELSSLKKEKKDGSSVASGCDNVDYVENASATGLKQTVNECSMLKKERRYRTGKGFGVPDANANVKSKPKIKQLRERSLSELTSKGRNSSHEMILRKNISKSSLKMKLGKTSKNSECTKGHMSLRVDTKRCSQERGHLSVMDSDTFCCVCGSSNKDELNFLLECGECLIRVHQACYGVSKVPKGHWYCRPCRNSSKNIVCVLCGYGGGAMTRALRTGSIVKSLLKAWNLETESKPGNSISSPEDLQDDFSLLHCPVIQNNAHPDSLCCVNKLKVHNSITAGVLDSTVKQWVHMVCGLWTPGTRCPNVDTMSAFDVSGATCPRANVVCSMCKRPGGSCIQCRVVNCRVRFHPWCAHQRGLLQSEVEGVDNENVGFYGRCMLHAADPTVESAYDNSSTETGCPGEKESSCARTEGYKGRKRDGFWHNLIGQSKGKGGCLVPQEQLNAWIHINGQKTCIPGLSKLPTSDMEYDCRKEYARYKQAKGWRHLVVYKSGIHALGLYTSRFISRGEMVVEYVGEIVGLRVSDKRENEYQSGRKLQYKSACYFFRIDKEHIIDATHKGGIARFVNHSCLPNCVAKVISVRNEKKVVFFAERDINPGEEITYDYHFNHEDEGEKIPCFCNSKNCRRYLN